MTFDTIYGNSAHQGGGIYHGGRGSKVELKDSIVAGNRAGTDPDFAGTLTTGGYNLIQDTSGVTFDDPGNKHATDLSGIQSSDLHIDPQLGNHGGPTQTEALLPGSPAIDAIPSDICHADGISTDQRGVRRPQGSKCDIGAYEYQPSP